MSGDFSAGRTSSSDNTDAEANGDSMHIRAFLPLSAFSDARTGTVRESPANAAALCASDARTPVIPA